MTSSASTVQDSTTTYCAVWNYCVSYGNEQISLAQSYGPAVTELQFIVAISLVFVVWVLYDYISITQKRMSV